MRFSLLWVASLLSAAALARSQEPMAARPPHVCRMSYIENRHVRLRVDLNLGGAITYLAPATNHDLNLINSHASVSPSTVDTVARRCYPALMRGSTNPVSALCKW